MIKIITPTTCHLAEVSRAIIRNLLELGNRVQYLNLLLLLWDDFIMTLHLQGLLPGKVPDTWLKEHWYFACTECQSLVADYHPDPPPPLRLPLFVYQWLL